jgi:hypothetical protein
MGWHINLVKNDLPLSIDAIHEITEASKRGGPLDDAGISFDGNQFHFSRSHLEWMDYMWRDELDTILRRHKVNGEVLFSSSEGDNAGQFWGYRYTDGVLTNLVGNGRDWTVEGEELQELETGRIPETLDDLQVGDEVAMAFHAYGMTSYERVSVGARSADGKIDVEGRLFDAKTFKCRSDFGSFELFPLNHPSVNLEEDEA